MDNQHSECVKNSHVGSEEDLVDRWENACGGSKQRWDGDYRKSDWLLVKGSTYRA